MAIFVAKEIRDQDVLRLFLEIMGDRYNIRGQIKKLGGMNNDNYKIPSSGKDLVFRLPGKGSNESVDRKNELFNSSLAYNMGLNCGTIYFDKKTGFKVSEYIRGAETLTIETANNKENMIFMAYALNTLHNSGVEFYRDFDPLGEIRDYKEVVLTGKGDLMDNYRELNTVLGSLEKRLGELPLEYVACHLDAWPENFVKSGCRIYLIDWEYSGNYDRLWDVVSIGLECNYTREEEDYFYRKYFGRAPSGLEEEKMDVLRVLMDVYWSMWALAKVSSGDKELYDYSLDRFRRGLGNFARLDA